ncbi:adenylosuccinate synthetase [Mycoplasma sp. (ex Biomphalaria glabrata)]|uniref:adenylosuccinate synthase n=1 Tax=Mycoplasma sp. (ex Biomphalaria glabrata) TaxID=1749074 RepID=UPI00073AA80A|nr:adenylosuccinate synthase [Mycoplasma sp. (ex Biomphalaria glabrata)]ALV23263.1 adenylosuccinate synthetase [Mycoplasma sp. (ex Biomphalaria glabrata)]
MKKQNLCVVGMLWGDEGKGKIIDYLTDSFDNIVRSQGGDNAGHTIVVNNVKYKLRLLPSGILHSNKTVILGNGVVVNLDTLAYEIEILENLNNGTKLKISDRAHLVMPYHIAMDELYEEIKGAEKVGTTKRGIGPCYEDKISRIGIRVHDLFDKVKLEKKITFALKIKNQILKAFGKETFEVEPIVDKYFEQGKKIQKYVDNTGAYLEKNFKQEKNALFEGAQGVMLCIDHGTYPYVTSSSPTAASIALGNGIDYHNINNTLGVIKAYATRVGEGSFLTEEISEIGDTIREKGHEYGTVTKRPRRIGWLDLVVLRHSQRVSGVNLLSVALIDVLSGIKNIKICTHYTLDGVVINDFPADLKILEKCQPVYKTFAGWDDELTTVRKYKDLPKNCRTYLEYIAEQLNCELALVSCGPSREQTILVNKEW